MSEYVETSVGESGVATLTVDRHERHNSLVPALLEECSDAIEGLSEAASDGSIRAVVLQTAGPSFSTGGDVRGFYDHREELAAYAERTVGGLNAVILGLMDLDVPVVTAVDGRVTGGALGLLLGSDVVLVGPDATVTPYYAAVGFSPDGGWTAILPELVGHARVAHAIATNETVEPRTAVAWGIASTFVEGGFVQTEAQRTAETITSMRPGALERTKRLLTQDRARIADRLAAEKESFVEQIETDEALEGMEAFLE